MGENTRAELTPFRVLFPLVPPDIWIPFIKTFHLNIYMWGGTGDLAHLSRALPP